MKLIPAMESATRHSLRQSRPVNVYRQDTASLEYFTAYDGEPVPAGAYLVCTLQGGMTVQASLQNTPAISAAPAGPTPGAWIVARDEQFRPGLHPYHEARFVQTADFDEDNKTGEVICTLRDGPHQASNARLLAAAPALLEALQVLLRETWQADKIYGDDHGESMCNNSTWEAARAAIAQATGKGAK